MKSRMYLGLEHID